MPKNIYFRSLIRQVKNGKEADNLGRYKSCHYFPEHVVLKTKKITYKPAKQQKLISQLRKLGINTPQIAYYQQSPKGYFEVQERAKGDQLFYSSSLTEFNLEYHSDMFESVKTSEILKQKLDEENFCKQYNLKNLKTLLHAPKEHFKNYIESFFIASTLDLTYDCHSGNIFYDKEKGFSFIDLPKIPNIVPSSKREDFFSRFVFSRDIKPIVLGILMPTSRKLSNSRNVQNYFYNTLLCHKILENIPSSDLHVETNAISKFKSVNLLATDNVACAKSATNTRFLVKNFTGFATDIEHKLLIEKLNGNDISIYSESNPELKDLVAFVEDKYKCIDKEEYFQLLNDCKIEDKSATEYFESTDLSNNQNQNNNDKNDSFFNYYTNRQNPTTTVTFEISPTNVITQDEYVNFKINSDSINKVDDYIDFKIEPNKQNKVEKPANFYYDSNEITQ